MFQISPEEVAVSKDSARTTTIAVDDGHTRETETPPPAGDLYTFAEILEAATTYFKGDTLAANTWATKYALRDPEGNFLEQTPADTHRRLAREFAEIESRYKNPMSEDEIFELFDRFRYVVPQGSPMSAVGNPYKVQSVSNCFLAGTKVLTTSGVKNIEEVVEGDRVVSHLGRVRPVVQTHRNPLAGRQLFTVKAFRTPEITVTGNHNFWSLTEEQEGWGESPQWNSIEQLRVGDWIALPRNNEQLETESTLDLAELLPELVYEPDSITYKYAVGDETIETLSTWTATSKLGNEHTCEKPHQPVKRRWKIDNNFAYFLGLWYGDGCVFNADKHSPRVRGITFTFGAHEKTLIGFVSEYGETLFGIKAAIVDNTDADGSVQVAFHAGLVGRVFEHLFGRSFSKKRFHPMMFSWDRERFTRCMVGLVASDGTVTDSGDVRVVMGNASLVDSFYHVARSFGMPFGRSTGTSIYKGETRTYARLDLPKRADILQHVHKTYEDDRLERAMFKPESTFKTKEIDGQVFVRLDKKIKSDARPEYVYTLGIAEDHSYSVEGLVCQNCFVVESPADSYGGILHTDQQQAQIMKRRGGVGFDISTIRPRGLPTANAAQTTDGIGIFMDRFSNTCREVAQGGRRGALMLTLDVHHPEVRTFINIKRDLVRVTGANISLRLSDEFLSAVRDGTDVQLRWPCDPSTKPVVEEWVDARALWDEIGTAAHACAEPGLLLWGNILKYSPADAYADVGYRTTSTNPCAELPLCPGDSCRLMVVNLASFVTDPFLPTADFDWRRFHSVVKKAQRLMDDLVDIELGHVDRIIAKIDADPEPEVVKRSERELWSRIRETTANGRRTGLGVTAVGDTVAMVGLKYGSDDSIDFVEKIYRALAVASYESSIEMAEERGCFPVYDFRKEQGHVFVERVIEAAGDDVRRKYEAYGRRNIANLTTAPTGSVSLLTQTSSGIEPLFEVLYTRKKKVNPTDESARVDEVDDLGDKWQKFTVRHHGLVQWQEVTGHGDKDLDKSPYWGAQAEQIDWTQRVKLQAAAQRWVDHAISSTLNLPEDVSVADVQKIYLEAWQSGCKGITIYRKNSRRGVLVKEEIFAQHSAPKRPDRLPCEVHRTRVRVGDVSEDWIFFVGLLEGKPFEIFGGTPENIELPRRLQRGTLIKRSFKSGGKYDFLYGDEDDPCTVKDFVRLFNNPDRGAWTRMVSLSLRHGAPIQYVVEQLQRDRDADMFDFAKSMARVLKSYIPDGSTPSDLKICPDCSTEGSLIYQEGCILCRACGHSKCG